MNRLFVFIFIAQAILLQNTQAQCLRTCGNILAGAAPAYGPCCGGPVVAPPQCVTGVPTTIVQPSVANTLADTLSLLTVSSLLAETLPTISGLPISACAPAAPYGRCGCGCGGGYNILI